MNQDSKMKDITNQEHNEETILLNRHITEEMICNLFSSQDTDSSNLECLSHISECDYCAEEFASYIEKYELIKAPRSLKESILNETAKLPAKIIVKKDFIRKQLFFYSMRVSAAMLGAILFLVVTVYQPLGSASTSQIKQDRFSFVQSISSNLRDFSDMCTKQLSDLVDYQDINSKTEVSKHD